MFESLSEENEVILELSVLPPSIRAVYDVLRDGTPRSVADIAAKAKYSRRTVQEALKILGQRKLVKRYPNLKDLRKNFYLLHQN